MTRAHVFALCVFVALAVFPGANAVTFPELPRGLGDSCVAPVEIMRKNHMDFLNHQRDLTVHDGIRGARHSLTGCVHCHAQQDSRGNFIAVDAPGQFCAACHAFTATAMDCFECHAAKPARAEMQ